MFKSLAVMEVKADSDRLYRLECDNNSPLGELYDAVCTMQQEVFRQMQEQVEKQKEPSEEENKPE